MIVDIERAAIEGLVVSLLSAVANDRPNAIAELLAAKKARVAEVGGTCLPVDKDQEMKVVKIQIRLLEVALGLQSPQGLVL